MDYSTLTTDELINRRKLIKLQQEILEDQDLKILDEIAIRNGKAMAQALHNAINS